MWGKDGEYREEEAHAGAFGYLARGEPHSIVNLSDNEDAELVFAYGGVPNQDAAGTRLVE